jgi:two-component system sensor histidine kinase/response regulator
LKLRIFITLAFSLAGLTSFGFVNRGRVDSLKTLVESNLKKAPDTTNINRLNSLAANYFDSNPDSTIYYAQKGMTLSRKINYKAGVADALVQTAHADYFKGRFSKAIQEFDEAIAIYSKLDDHTGLSNCYMLYGRMYNYLASYKSALHYLNLALDINKKYANETYESDCYKNIGIVYYSEGQLSTALDYYYKALYLSIKLQNKLFMAADYNDIGVVLQSMELYPKALDYFRKSLKLFEGTKSLNGVGTIYENIGEIMLKQNKYDKAISYLNKSLVIAKKQDDKEGLMSDYTDLGVGYGYTRRFKEAASNLDSALKITRTYKDVYNETITLIGFATVYNLEKDYKNAYKYAMEGQGLAIKLGNVSVRSNAALQLNKTLAGLGKFDRAYTLLRQYIELKDSLNNNESIQKLTSYNLEINFDAKKKQLAQQQHERDLLYQQRMSQQRLINTIFSIIILGMIAVSMVYYRQKRKQQKINAMLEEKNHEVLAQKTSIDEQAQKLNDLNTLKDRLISVLAHDLRAPLSTLRGLFDLLQDDTISHEQMLEMIPGVLKKLEYTSDFLDTLLFWINSQMENFESSAKNFYVKDIVSFEADNYQEQAALKGITLIDSVAEDVVASADPNSIRIVIRNLITNAIKFSREGDTIEIAAERGDSENYVITVKDTGTGMSEDQLKKLFKSKVNSKAGTQNESGTGMGMLFCKDLVERCSGRIWVNSKQGEGTAFSFTVPTGFIAESRLEVA